MDKVKVQVKSLSRVRLFATPWTIAHQAPPPMEFSRQEYWSGLPFLSLGDLPNPGMEPASPESLAFASDSFPLFHLGSLKQFILSIYKMLHYHLDSGNTR